MPDYKVEFPDFPDLDVPLPEGYEDVSEHNDVTPRFDRTLQDGRVITIWVDHPSPHLREVQGYARFYICCECIPGFGSDNWKEILAWDARQ